VLLAIAYLVSCLVTYFRPPHFLPNDMRGASVFSALTLLVGRQEGPVKKTEWWGASMAICLERGVDLHMV